MVFCLVLRAPSPSLDRVEAGPTQRQESRNLPVCQPGEPRDSSAGLEAAAETRAGGLPAQVCSGVEASRSTGLSPAGSLEPCGR